jgi:hypothetical protein
MGSHKLAGMDTVKILAFQAKSFSSYKNIKTKLLKCCKNIYFNKQCKIPVSSWDPIRATIIVPNWSIKSIDGLIKGL